MVSIQLQTPLFVADLYDMLFTLSGTDHIASLDEHAAQARPRYVLVVGEPGRERRTFAERTCKVI